LSDEKAREPGEPNKMALSIKHPETERLARSLAKLTGENITMATKRGIEERLRRLGGGHSRKAGLLEDMAEIRRGVAMPLLDFFWNA